MNFSPLYSPARLAALYRLRRTSYYPFALKFYVSSISRVAKRHCIRLSSFRRYVIGRGRVTMGGVRIYPYSRRLPVDSGPTKDHEINIQSGEYIRSWFIARNESNQPGKVYMGVGNLAPHAIFLHLAGGTSKMRARPIAKVVGRLAVAYSQHTAVKRFHRMALGSLPG